VRTNRRRATRESLIARLWEEERIEARPTGLAPEGLIIADGGRPGQWRAFADGWCVVQDEASMLVARLLDPRPGELVVDACAAPGTKATHLAELMDDRGRVLALDPHARRLGLLEASARRLGLTILEGHPGSVDKHAGRWRDRADRVLVDAPCSNLGVLRRNPEVKWRRTAGDIEGLNRQQQAILSSAARMARSGGWLVYATCSLEPDENEEVVLPFLRAHPDWGIEAPAEFPVGPDARGFIRLWPHLHGSDGFTAIRLRRR
jgi:16S rRNA (cytosine967-C5)-methyltransferase